MKTIPVNINVAPEYQRLQNKNKRGVLLVGVLALVLIVTNLCVGSSDVGIADLFALITGQAAESTKIVFLNLRIPHVLCSMLVGAGLGVCGCILQSCLGNTLASPSTIGISQGASCGACVAIIALGSVYAATGATTAIFAFIFALIPTALIFALSKTGRLSSTGIILAGVAMSIFFSGIVALVEYFADSSKVAEVVFWSFGSVHNAGYVQLIIMAVIILVCWVFAQLNALNYNAMECGDTTANAVGINVQKSRIAHMVVAALGTAAITAFCGTINFVGLIAPHIMRRVVGANYKTLIPASALCGICIVTISDILSSVLMPGAILPIGAITSFIGAPIFVYCILRKESGR